MTSRTPRRHRRLALMAAGTAAAMILLPGAASAQVVHSAQQIASIPGGPAVPPGSPVAPSHGAMTPNAPVITEPGNGANPGDLASPGGSGGLGSIVDGLLGSGRDKDRDREDRRDGHEHHGGGEHRDGDVQRDDSPDSGQIKDPKPPDHSSGAVGDVDLLKSHLLDITKYDATIEDDGSAHSDSTVLGLGGSRIIGSSASSEGREHEGRREHQSGLCPLGNLLCLGLLYHDTVATQDHDSTLAAARGGLAALCLGGRDNTTTSYECNGILSLGVAEGRGLTQRDKEHGHTKAESANELLNLCLGKREKLTTPCEGLGLRAVHSDTDSKSDKPETNRRSFLLGIDSNGKSSYLLDDPFALALPQDCGDSALLCLLLNQGKSVIFHNPKGAGSAQEALRLDVLNRTLLVVLGQSETLVHETDGQDHGKPGDHGGNGDDHGNGNGPGAKGEDHGTGENNGNGGNNGQGPELAETGADIAPLLAGGFLLTGLGALTVAATRRRVGKHSVI